MSETGSEAVSGFEEESLKIRNGFGIREKFPNKPYLSKFLIK